MTTMLASRAKDLLCAVEFYASDYTPHVTFGFNPSAAEALFATETATFNYVTSGTVTVNYFREALSMPSLTRSTGKQSNSVTISFSNVSRRLSDFVLANEVEGMRVVIRLISRAKLLTSETSWVIFVGKCKKANGFDRKDASITAQQDLGRIEALIPPQVFQKDCPLRFAGTDCLGTELLTEKNAAFQAAFAAFGEAGCNKTHGACSTFGNLEFRQGIRILQLPGSFVHKPHHGLLYKLIRYSTPIGYVASKLFGRKPTTVGSSLEDGTPYGSAIPFVLGRWQMTGIPLQFRDDGETVHVKMGWCRGPVTSIFNFRCNSPEFVSTPVTVVHHYGRYGGEADQLADTVFPDASFHSRLAYSTAGVIGSNIAVEDPAPNMSAIVAGFVSDLPVGPRFTGEGHVDDGSIGYTDVFQYWTDNPANIARIILSDPALLNNVMDEARTAVTSAYCDGAIQDDTNAERLVLPDTETGKAGVEYKRYNSTGLIVPASWPVTNNITPIPLANHEADYEFYDPDAPPSSVALKTFYRRRYTCNIALTEQRKAVDFLYDTVLPCFRGYLSWNPLGQVGVRCEKPADSSLMRLASIVGATSIRIEDVMPWAHRYDVPGNLTGKVLIGVGLATSEARTVTSTQFTADANAITLDTDVTGSVVATPSGATFSGGSTSTAATASIVISGSFAEGATVTAIINGVEATYTLFAGEDSHTVAAGLAFAINANRTLKRFVEAACPDFAATINLTAKWGTLLLSSALVNAHDEDEETIRVMMTFAGHAENFVAAGVTRANVLDGSFHYLGNDGQTRYNEFKGTYHDPLRDFAEQDVIIRDYDHQDLVKKVNALTVDLSAVDNFNQASRLLNGAAVKHGDLAEFFAWGSNGLALQLEEGDVVCISDTSGDFINQPVRIESLTVNSRYEVSFKARQYSTSAYDDFVEETDVPLVTGTGFGDAPAAITFNTTDFPPNGLVQATDGTAGITSIRGGAVFPTRRNATYAYVRLIKRAGVTVNEQVAIIYPDDNLEATFEFIASADGLYTVELEVCNQWGCNTTKPTADIIVGFGSLFGLAMEDGFLLLTEAGDIIELEH